MISTNVQPLAFMQQVHRPANSIHADA